MRDQNRNFGCASAKTPHLTTVTGTIISQDYGRPDYRIELFLAFLLFLLREY